MDEILRLQTDYQMFHMSIKQRWALLKRIRRNGVRDIRSDLLC
jgi:hypothetical protein